MVVYLPLFAEFCTWQVVQDFSHQQYHFVVFHQEMIGILMSKDSRSIWCCCWMLYFHPVKRFLSRSQQGIVCFFSQEQFLKFNVWKRNEHFNSKTSEVQVNNDLDDTKWADLGDLPLNFGPPVECTTSVKVLYLTSKPNDEGENHDLCCEQVGDNLRWTPAWSLTTMYLVRGSLGLGALGFYWLRFILQVLRHDLDGLDVVDRKWMKNMCIFLLWFPRRWVNQQSFLQKHARRDEYIPSGQGISDNGTALNGPWVGILLTGQSRCQSSLGCMVKGWSG